MQSLEVTFSLAFGTRRDEDADVYVGYCPLLNLYSQGTTEEEAETAVVDAAQLFIVTCYGRDTLHRVLRSRGMKKAIPGTARSESSQYITVKEFKELEDYDRPFERDVSIDLLAGVGQDAAACLQ